MFLADLGILFLYCISTFTALLIGIFFFEWVLILFDNVLRVRLLKKAHFLALKTKKPILNISCGETDYGDVNADISPQKVPNFILYEPEKPLPFPDKYFCVVYSTHTLEHVNGVESYIKELQRVGDQLFLVFPLVSFIAFNPNHRWIFTDRSGRRYFKNFMYHPFQERFPPNPFIYFAWRWNIRPRVKQLRDLTQLKFVFSRNTHLPVLTTKPVFTNGNKL
jgi:SAM-dependent methyltransferase